MARRGTTAHALYAAIGEGGAMEMAARAELRRLVEAHPSPRDLAARLGVSERQVYRLTVGLGLRERDARKANNGRKRRAPGTRMQRLGCECAGCRRVA